MIFLQARESFVITTGIDTKLGSAPKSKVGISRTGDRKVFFLSSMGEGSDREVFFLKYARRIRRIFFAYH